MNYKEGLKKVLKETTVSGGEVFGTAQGIGQQGGNVGNVDFYAPGNAMNLFGYEGSKKNKRKKKKKGFTHLYRRAFVEMMNEEVDPILDCIVVIGDSAFTPLLEDYLNKNKISYIIEEQDVISVRGTDKYLQHLVSHLQKVTLSDAFQEGDVTILIGEFE